MWGSRVRFSTDASQCLDILRRDDRFEQVTDL